MQYKYLEILIGFFSCLGVVVSGGERAPYPEDPLLVVVNHVCFAPDFSRAPTHMLFDQEAAGPSPPLPGKVDPPWDRFDRPVGGKSCLRPALLSMKIYLK